MKKKILPVAIGAATAVTMSAAHAQMFINEGGTGEILVLPFYSAQGGNATNVNIANTTTDGKAVKVRIIEGENSQEVLDFNLYMSPEDHFSFGISATADGGGMLKTSDTSCTVPAIPADGVPFRSTLYATGTSADKNTDADVGAVYDNTSIERTAVGYIEIIEMGQLDGDTGDYDGDADTADSANPVLAAITHGASGVPADCSVPVAAWSTSTTGVPGEWLADSTAYFDTNWDGGGLYAYAGVVNAADATAFGQDADAIQNIIADATAGGGQLHYKPGDTRPDFEDAAITTEATAVVNGEQDAGNDYGLPLNAVSAVFQTTTLANDYVTDPGILGQTDWVITMPTKGLHIDKTDKEPFSVAWNGRTACEYAKMSAWDREEGTLAAPDQSGAPDFSPAPETEEVETYDLPLCYEVTVVQFGSESAVKTDSIVQDGSPYLPGNDGWGEMSFKKSDLTADSATVITNDRLVGDLEGLPVTGFAVQNYGNDSLNASGSVANYAMSNEHKTNTTSSQ